MPGAAMEADQRVVNTISTGTNTSIAGQHKISKEGWNNEGRRQ